MAPWPHICSGPTLLKKITPAAQERSEGSNKRAPTSTSEPRGSLTTAERQRSCCSRKTCQRSATVPAPRSGAPATTTRVGSPPVWLSTNWILRGFISFGGDGNEKHLAIGSQLAASSSQRAWRRRRLGGDSRPPGYSVVDDLQNP